MGADSKQTRIDTRLVRRVFVVLLADGNHGKSTLIQRLISLGQHWKYQRAHKGARVMRSFEGREIDALIFPRSFQEIEGKDHDTPREALDAIDPKQWFKRELIVMPSHVNLADVKAMLETAHSAGFDAVCASMMHLERDWHDYPKVWALDWDERWTLVNRETGPRKEIEGGLNALAASLLSRLSALIYRA